MIEATAKLWVEILGRHDFAALESAFDTVERTVERWPAPARIIAALPAYRPSPSQERHKRLSDEGSARRIDEVIAECAKRLRVTL